MNSLAEHRRNDHLDLSVVGVAKTFGSVQALRDISLMIEHGELVSLLGPSGCGKTTTLFLIAGFEAVSAGEIWIRGRRIDPLPPEQRNTGMVFQNYALFPHMTVAENIAYGLRVRRVPRRDIKARVARVLALVKMDSMADRLPRTLSGGQQQRAALARALVIEPALLLLDEAFGALDRQLREEMQIEMRSLQRRLNITTILVTHDQGEALSISDRVAVMNAGAIEQCATPTELYDRPASRFVAGFIGASNFIPGRVCGVEAGRLVVETAAGRVALPQPRRPIEAGRALELLVRPERMELKPADGVAGTNATIIETAYFGANAHIHVELADGQRALVSDSDPTAHGTLCYRPGEAVKIGIEPRGITLFVDGLRHD